MFQPNNGGQFERMRAPFVFRHCSTLPSSSSTHAAHGRASKSEPGSLCSSLEGHRCSVSLPPLYFFHFMRSTACARINEGSISNHSITSFGPQRTGRPSSIHSFLAHRRANLTFQFANSEIGSQGRKSTSAVYKLCSHFQFSPIGLTISDFCEPYRIWKIG